MNENKFIVQNKRLYEEIIDLFLKLLSESKYKVGDKLPSIPELAKIFGVGKPSLREALSVLASSGVVEIKQGKGIYVKRLSVGNIQHSNITTCDNLEHEKILYWLELRRGIEIEAAGLAAKRRNNTDLQEIIKVHYLIEEELKMGENAARLDFEFHQLIGKATHNPMFTDALDTNSHILQQQLFENLRQTVDFHSRRELVIKEHKRLLESIENGDEKAARRFMAKHIDNALRKVRIISEI